MLKGDEGMRSKSERISRIGFDDNWKKGNKKNNIKILF